MSDMIDIPTQPVAPDPAWDRAFAERAAGYLFDHGLCRDDVVRCLVEECGIDAVTAHLVAA